MQSATSGPVAAAYPLEYPPQSLEHVGYNELSCTETLCLLRWLTDTLMDTAAVRSKINHQLERMTRQTVLDRKKAESAQDKLAPVPDAASGEIP